MYQNDTSHSKFTYLCKVFSGSDMYNEMGSPIHEGGNILVKRYERLLKTGESAFFDIDEFEELITHYIYAFEYQKAKRALQFARSQHPHASTLLLLEATLLGLTDHQEKALSVLNKIEPLERNNPEFLLTKADILCQIEKHEEAIHVLRKVPLLDPASSPDIYFRIGIEYQHLGSMEESLRYLKRAATRDTDNMEILHEIAWCYDMLEAYDDCIKIYQTILDNQPYSAHTWYNLGCVYNSLELYEKAIDAFDFAIAISQEWADPYYNKGNALSGLGRFKEAIICYKEVMHLESPSEVIYYYIGECYENLEEFDMAIAYYKKSLNIDPEYADALTGIGVTLFLSDKNRQSLPYLYKATEIEPANIDAWSALTLVNANLGLLEATAVSFKKVITYRTFERRITDMINHLFQLKMYDTAENVINYGLEQHPQDTGYLYALAACSIKTGHIQRALELLKDAVGRDTRELASFYELAPEATSYEIIESLLQNHKTDES